MSKVSGSNITFITGVTGISRKFARRVDTATIKNVTRGKVIGNKVMGEAWLGSARHFSPLQNRNVYHLVVRLPHATYSTGAQTINRGNFAMTSQYVAQMAKDLMTLSRNQQKYIDSKNDPSKTIRGINAKGYSIRGWWFAICFDKKKTDGELYQGYELPAFDA